VTFHKHVALMILLKYVHITYMKYSLERTKMVQR